jgi:hypothetical protein
MSTIYRVMRCVIIEMQAYGFEMGDGNKISLDRKRNGELSGLIKLEWPVEPATGQAAWSQKTVQVKATVHVDPANLVEHEHGYLHIEVPDSVVNIEVQYVHHNNGANGVRRTYHFVDSTLKLAGND